MEGIMTEILWHGRGGQGAFTAARLLGAAYALKSGDAAIAAQGALLLLSPKLFVEMYRRVMP